MGNNPSQAVKSENAMEAAKKPTLGEKQTQIVNRLEALENHQKSLEKIQTMIEENQRSNERFQRSIEENLNNIRITQRTILNGQQNLLSKQENILFSHRLLNHKWCITQIQIESLKKEPQKEKEISLETATDSNSSSIRTEKLKEIESLVKYAKCVLVSYKKSQIESHPIRLIQILKSLVVARSEIESMDRSVVKGITYQTRQRIKLLKQESTEVLQSFPTSLLSELQSPSYQSGIEQDA